MNGNRTIARSADARHEDFVADLTAAAYRVALRRGVGNQWLELELDLWHAMQATVKKWDRQSSQPLKKVSAT